MVESNEFVNNMPPPEPVVAVDKQTIHSDLLVLARPILMEHTSELIDQLPSLQPAIVYIKYKPAKPYNPPFLSLPKELRLIIYTWFIKMCLVCSSRRPKFDLCVALSNFSVDIGKLRQTGICDTASLLSLAYTCKPISKEFLEYLFFQSVLSVTLPSYNYRQPRFATLEKYLPKIELFHNFQLFIKVNMEEDHKKSVARELRIKEEIEIVWLELSKLSTKGLSVKGVEIDFSFWHFLPTSNTERKAIENATKSESRISFPNIKVDIAQGRSRSNAIVWWGTSWSTKAPRKAVKPWF